jgi:hypothetical protein
VASQRAQTYAHHEGRPCCLLAGVSASAAAKSKNQMLNRLGLLTNLIRHLQSPRHRAHRPGQGHAPARAQPALTIQAANCRIFGNSSLIFLAKRFNTPYYSGRMNRLRSGHELVWQVDVLSRAVEISADGLGLPKFAPLCL